MLQRNGGASAWADVADDEVLRLIDVAKSEGFDHALASYEAQAPFFVKRLRNTALGNWHVLLARPSSCRVLDVGCGFGALLAGLQAAYARAFGIDVLHERLRLAALRSGGQPTRLVRASGHMMPFRTATLDLVTLNGVLEWAAYYREGDPGTLQVDLLREIRGIVADDGTIGVAIENRFALETLAGLPDTHTGLLLIPALPRRFASFWSRTRGGGEYRTYLYSRAGYEALFREAGWDRVRVLDLAPSYNDYDFVIDAADGSTYALLWRHGLVRSFVAGTGPVRQRLAALQPRWLGLLSYAYLVLAGTTTCVLDASHGLWSVLQRAGLEPGEARFAADMLRPGAVAIVTHAAGSIRGVAVMTRQASNSSAITDLRSQRLAALLAGRLEPLDQVEFAGYQVAAYSVRQ